MKLTNFRDHVGDLVSQEFIIVNLIKLWYFVLDIPQVYNN